MTFKDYFDAYDAGGVLHAGFLQSMDFSGITSDITMLNDLTMAMMDAYLFNEFSSAIVMKNWREYMEYNREEERLEIKSAFYADFVKALYGYLARSQKWYELTQTDFTSLSATDIKTLEHGKKETEKEYGATQTTRAYGAGEITRAYGAGQKTNVHGAQSVTRDYDRVVVTLSREDDTHIVGAAHTEGTGSTTGMVYPLGASAYVDDTKQTQSTEQDTDAQTNTEKYGDQETTTAARQDGESKATYTDTESEAAKTDRESSAAKTDTESSTARTDTEEIKAYTDTERRTRFIVISPDKYFEISKELADIGVYDLMKCAVKETMLLNVWDGGDCYDDHIL